MLMIEGFTSALRSAATELVRLPVLAGLFALAVVAAGVVAVRAVKKPRPNRGPGPAGIPILGNALDMPSENDFLVYTSWAKKWGAYIRVGVRSRIV
jgi:hypothetical protein